MNDLSGRFLPPLRGEEEAPPRPRLHRAGPFGVLDIGSTKIACLIGRVETDGTLRVLGTGWRLTTYHFLAARQPWLQHLGAGMSVQY